MDAITLTGLALALAMDAFAVALGTGAVLSRLTGRHIFRLGFHFGLFQALMPVIGWLAGRSIMQWVAAWDHWIAFSLLALIGGRMIYEAFRNEEKADGVSIWMPALVIGMVAGVLTVTGMLLGGRIGDRWGTRVEIFGGLVLIAIGFKILIEHLTG
jgi:putative Mn2+ efflux pump MntP